MCGGTPQYPWKRCWQLSESIKYSGVYYPTMTEKRDVLLAERRIKLEEDVTNLANEYHNDTGERISITIGWQLDENDPYCSW